MDPHQRIRLNKAYTADHLRRLEELPKASKQEARIKRESDRNTGGQHARRN